MEGTNSNHLHKLRSWTSWHMGCATGIKWRAHEATFGYRISSLTADVTNVATETKCLMCWLCMTTHILKREAERRTLNLESIFC